MNVSGRGSPHGQPSGSPRRPPPLTRGGCLEPAGVQMSVSGEEVALVACGEFDMATAHLLGDALRKACDAGLSVVLDLSDVTFLDARGLREIVQAYRSLSRSGCSLSVVNARPPVHRVFELTGLLELVAA